MGIIVFIIIYVLIGFFVAKTIISLSGYDFSESENVAIYAIITEFWPIIIVLFVLIVIYILLFGGNHNGMA